MTLSSDGFAVGFILGNEFFSKFDIETVGFLRLVQGIRALLKRKAYLMVDRRLYISSFYQKSLKHQKTSLPTTNCLPLIGIDLRYGRRLTNTIQHYAIIQEMLLSNVVFNTPIS